MTPEQRLLIEEYVRRRVRSAEKPLNRLRDPSFHVQNQVLNDRESRYKAVNCTRRGGKSVGEAIDHFEICEEFAGSRTLYLGLTLDSVSEIIWDVMKELNDRGGYGCKFNEVKRIVRFPNGSRIRLFGLDTSERQMKKILGQKNRKVTIDEAGSMTQDMVKVCYQMIDPTLTDLAPFSWFHLVGTCENIPNTFFEKVVTGKESFLPWKVYRWTAYENPHMREQWTKQIELYKKQNPDVIHASWFKTHYLNEWCSDDELLIVAISEKNFTDSLPKLDLFYVLGVDLGFNDATAFSVMAYSLDAPTCWVVETYKESGYDITDTANKIKELQRRYNVSKIVVDGANKQGVEEMKKRHRIPMTPAEKQGKASYLRMLKDDCVQSNLMLLRTGNGELVTEWSQLQWKDENKQEEDPRCQNHLSDATLYAWRECKNYTYDPEDQPPHIDTDEYMDDFEKREAEELRREVEENEWWEMAA
jgi:hypothetical protein